eukprot:1777724-Rhodomonas_salina.1
MPGGQLRPSCSGRVAIAAATADDSFSIGSTDTILSQGGQAELASALAQVEQLKQELEGLKQSGKSTALGGAPSRCSGGAPPRCGMRGRGGARGRGSGGRGKAPEAPPPSKTVAPSRDPA